MLLSAKLHVAVALKKTSGHQFGQKNIVLSFERAGLPRPAYRDSDNNNVTLFILINTFYTCQADDDGWYVYVYHAEWRNVHSGNFYMSLL